MQKKVTKITAPIKYKKYDGLTTILMRCIQLTHLFLEKGYLVRGGIDVGNLWHTKSIDTIDDNINKLENKHKKKWEYMKNVIVDCNYNVKTKFTRSCLITNRIKPKRN